ncbi:MAG: hypothetical protein ACRDL8_21335 [Solirubrobacteraceae bacterium]
MHLSPVLRPLLSVAAAAALAGGASAMAGASGKRGVHRRVTGHAARQYLANSAPAERLSARFEASALSWIGDPAITNAKAVATARPLVVALASLKHDLDHERWPAPARHDIAALSASCGRLVTDLRSLSRVDLAKTSTWEAPLLRDDTRATAAGAKVRHDLGLPPLP